MRKWVKTLCLPETSTGRLEESRISGQQTALKSRQDRQHEVHKCATASLERQADCQDSISVRCSCRQAGSALQILEEVEFECEVSEGPPRLSTCQSNLPQGLLRVRPRRPSALSLTGIFWKRTAPVPLAVAVVFNCPSLSQFIESRSLKQAAPQSIWLFQESLIRDFSRRP
jgi:hypothetical protein